MISATIVGNLGRDAEIRSTQTGSVCSFSVASTERGGKGREDKTTWIRVSLWGKRGEGLVQYLTKGSKVAVRGALSVREHDGKPYVECRADDATNDDSDIPF